MARPRKNKTDPNQLSLFETSPDVGYDKPPVVVERTPVVQAIPRPRQGFVGRLNPGNTTIVQPNPFERTAYELYQKARAEARNLSNATGVLIVALVSVAILDVQVQEAAIGFFKFGSVKQNVLVGLLGWLTILAAIWTLFRSAYASQKHRQSGEYYQLVMRFSHNPLWGFCERIIGNLFVAAHLGIIALAIVIARHEMIGLIDFIFRGLLMLNDPWRAVVTPA